MRRTAFAGFLLAVLLMGTAAWAETQITILNISLGDCAEVADDLCGKDLWLIGYNFKTRTCTIACVCEEPDGPVPTPEV